MQKIIKITIFITIFIIIIFDLFILMIVFHELTHKFDFRNIDKTDERICFLGCGDDAGYYKFYYNIEDREEVLRIHKYSERNADIVSILWCLISFFIVIKTYDILEKCKI